MSSSTLGVELGELLADIRDGGVQPATDAVTFSDAVQDADSNRDNAGLMSMRIDTALTIPAASCPDGRQLQ